MNPDRPYQAEMINNIYEAWNNGINNICSVLPTGAGKTHIFSRILQNHNGYCAALAHRQELVSQIATALARNGVYHRIIAPPNIIRNIVKIQKLEFGRSYYDAKAKCGVIGVDTLIGKSAAKHADWCKKASLFVTDECHHVLKENKWGKASEMFPNAKILGVTATPVRADRKGLSMGTDGIFEEMIVGPCMRDLINMGYLCDYKIYAPRTNIDLTDADISKSTGDYNKKKLVTAVHKSKIVGDVVEHYLKIAPGKLGVTFCVDVESCHETADAFNAAGVPAIVLSAKTPDYERAEALKKFRDREILQIVNVDLLGEGFDCPGIEVVSMARPTKSYGLYVQKFGRALRTAPGKEWAIIIDHVNNVITHGLPDAARVWDMDGSRGEGSGGGGESLPLTTCTKCTMVYERFLGVCPHCGHVETPVRNDGPEFVDGNLFEIDQATLALMRGEVDKIDRHVDEVRMEYSRKHMPNIGIMRMANLHVANQESQKELRKVMGQWAGYRRYEGRDDSQIYRLFYHRFGVDMLSAKALKTKDAEKLKEKVETSYL